MRFVLLSVVILAGMTVAGIASAQGQYQPIVSVPFLGAGNQSFEDYINALYWLSIVVGAFLAVVKIIFGGVKWMLSDVVTDKGSAKKDIQGAVIGLLIILSAVLVLNTINKNLTCFSIFGETDANCAPVLSNSNINVQNNAGGNRLYADDGAFIMREGDTYVRCGVQVGFFGERTMYRTAEGCQELCPYGEVVTNGVRLPGSNTTRDADGVACVTRATQNENLEAWAATNSETLVRCENLERGTAAPCRITCESENGVVYRGIRESDGTIRAQNEEFCASPEGTFVSQAREGNYCYAHERVIPGTASQFACFTELAECEQHNTARTACVLIENTGVTVGEQTPEARYVNFTWTELPFNQYCNDVKGPGWASVGNYCSGERPAGATCCSYDSERQGPQASEIEWSSSYTSADQITAGSWCARYASGYDCTGTENSCGALMREINDSPNLVSACQQYPLPAGDGVGACTGGEIFETGVCYADPNNIDANVGDVFNPALYPPSSTVEARTAFENSCEAKGHSFVSAENSCEFPGFDFDPIAPLPVGNFCRPFGDNLRCDSDFLFCGDSTRCVYLVDDGTTQGTALYIYRNNTMEDVIGIEQCGGPVNNRSCLEGGAQGIRFNENGTLIAVRNNNFFSGTNALVSGQAGADFQSIIYEIQGNFRSSCTASSGVFNNTSVITSHKLHPGLTGWLACSPAATLVSVPDTASCAAEGRIFVASENVCRNGLVSGPVNLGDRVSVAGVPIELFQNAAEYYEAHCPGNMWVSADGNFVECYADIGTIDVNVGDVFNPAIYHPNERTAARTAFENSCEAKGHVFASNTGLASDVGCRTSLVTGPVAVGDKVNIESVAIELVRDTLTRYQARCPGITEASEDDRFIVCYANPTTISAQVGDVFDPLMYPPSSRTAARTAFENSCEANGFFFVESNVGCQDPGPIRDFMINTVRQECTDAGGETTFNAESHLLMCYIPTRFFTSSEYQTLENNCVRPQREGIVQIPFAEIDPRGGFDVRRDFSCRIETP